MRTAARRGWMRAGAFVCLGAAAALHSVMVQGHLHEWLFAGIFFLLLAMVQAYLATALVIAPQPWVGSATIGVSTISIVVWALSQGIGMPVGPASWHPESAELLGLSTTALEAIACLLTAGLPRSSWRLDKRLSGMKRGARADAGSS